MVSIASEFSLSSASSTPSSEASLSPASSTSSEAASTGTILYTPLPSGPNRRISRPIRQPLRPPTGVGGPENPRITDDALLEHIWGQPSDDSLSWLGRIMWGGFPQYSRPASEPFGTHNPLAINGGPRQPVPTQNPLLNNPRPRQSVIVDGSAGWRERQRQMTIANMGPAQLQEEMTRLREQERQARRRIAHLLRPPWTMADNSEFISPNIPPRDMTVRMEFPLRVLDDHDMDNIANGIPQHVRQRSGHEPFGQRSDQVQVREEESEGADPFSHVNPFHRGRNLPRWATYSNLSEE
ncbi:hypothetical protein QBC32DRAFT_204145 [Pseudoneurospora amorphoporcata]|uniref:Uncharacterized protein n=1 Tax=Pseudoneurospora amorphoporcata TaxID=241081 RepID=A0AAN6P3C2_9PEZI|nr:hypothetical protein QBC32DRAFT_204145 [Pseudoneurospora amorphoporcata]